MAGGGVIPCPVDLACNGATFQFLCFCSVSVCVCVFHIFLFTISLSPSLSPCLPVNCWPSENAGKCEVNIEYELLQSELELIDVIISIPCP